MAEHRIVPVFVDRVDGDGEDFVFVAVNGKAWQIPKGRTVNVPWFVGEELRRSKVARGRRDEYMRRNGQ